MPDVETQALIRAKTLREEINARTGVNDATVTEGVKRLLRGGGDESIIQHEASTHLDIFPDPIIAREEFSRMMDYGNFEVSEVDLRTEFSYFEYAEFIGNSNQVVQFDFTLQSTDKFEIDIDMQNNCGTGVSNASKSGTTCSVLSTKNSGKIGFRDTGFFVNNTGRGKFGKDYNTGIISLYDQTFQGSRSLSMGGPNYTNYIMGCWLENGTEYYYLKGKFYNLKIWSNGVLTRDIYPGNINIYWNGSLLEGDQRGLYDIINKKMYPSPNLVYPNSYVS